MYTIAVIVHLIVCFLMIASILLQAGKGAEIGAAFGGTSQTIFGSRGAGTFLSKVTIWTAAIFMLTSLGLALLSKHDNIASSVIDASSVPRRAAPAGTSIPSDTSRSDSAAPATPDSRSDSAAP